MGPCAFCAPGECMTAKSDSLPALSIAFGIGAFITMMFGGTPLLASLGIIFALLSRREKMETKAVVGLIFSAAALVIYVLILAATAYILIATGTMAKIIEEINQVNANSVNAAGDIMTIIQRNLLELYQSLSKGGVL